MLVIGKKVGTETGLNRGMNKYNVEYDWLV